MGEPGSGRRDRRVDDASLSRVVLEDLKQTRLQGGYLQDLKDLYYFYLDHEERVRLASMGRIQRAVWVLGGLLKSLLMKLSPGRRISLVFALVLATLGNTNVRVGTFNYLTDFRLSAVAILVVILMLELKDKLAAKDEIQIARQVQLALLPHKDPKVPGWSVWNDSRPANDVGGDLVDYIELDGFRHGIALGDVAGKGLGAALLSSKLQATLRALAPEAASLEDLGARLNAILYRDGLDNRYATLFYAELEHYSGQVRYVNAGHNPAYVIRADGHDLLEPSSFPLGMLTTAAYEEKGVTLEPGDTLLAYSDGLTEATNANGEEFGEARVKALVRDLRNLPPETIGTRILEDVDRFLGDVRPHDDLSLVVIVRDA